MSRRYVFRLVVDEWPTKDGQPFVDQDLDFWADVAACAQRPNHQGHTECACPEWLPTDLSPYLVPAGVDYHPDPPAFTRRVGSDGEAAEYDTGYPGCPGYDVIAVPVATPRRRFQKAALLAAANQLRAWGCEAHVERAEVGEWAAI